MSGQVDHLDAAYEAVRAHLHERPYDTDPSRVYRDLGSVVQLLGALTHVVSEMTSAVDGATRADDEDRDGHVDAARLSLAVVDACVDEARVHLNDAWSQVSHLIFAPEAVTR